MEANKKQKEDDFESLVDECAKDLDKKVTLAAPKQPDTPLSTGIPNDDLGHLNFDFLGGAGGSQPGDMKEM